MIGFLRVIRPGEISGATRSRSHRPGHDATVAPAFRAARNERELLPRLLVAAEALHPSLWEMARTYKRIRPVQVTTLGP